MSMFRKSQDFRDYQKEIYQKALPIGSFQKRPKDGVWITLSAIFWPLLKGTYLEPLFNQLLTLKKYKPLCKDIPFKLKLYQHLLAVQKIFWKETVSLLHLLIRVPILNLDFRSSQFWWLQGWSDSVSTAKS